jgi:ABC-type antimicrobial peptide transport system permease subunit
LTAGDSSQPELYSPFTQLGGRLPVPVVTLLVRTDGNSAQLLSALRTAVREADPGLAPDAVGTLENRMLTALARPRLYAILLGGFAALALLLAAVGLFGVLSYNVALRSPELAVRMALGARPADIVRLVMRQGLAVTGAGLAAGLLGAAWALLYGVTEHDAVSYLVVPLVLLAAAAVSCIVPARRAARLDPLRLLRSS